MSSWHYIIIAHISRCCCLWQFFHLNIFCIFFVLKRQIHNSDIDLVRYMRWVWAAKVCLFYYLANIDSDKTFTLQLLIFYVAYDSCGRLILLAFALGVKNNSFNFCLLVRRCVMHFRLLVLIWDTAPINQQALQPTSLVHPCVKRGDNF